MKIHWKNYHYKGEASAKVNIALGLHATCNFMSLIYN